MNGGDVQGYAPGGAVDYINVAKNYKPSFNPFDPDFGLGMYSSSLMKPKTAADIQEQAAGVSTPRQEVKKRKEQPDGPDSAQDNISMGFSEKTTSQIEQDIQEMKDIQGKKGILGLIANSFLGKAHLSNMEKEVASRPDNSVNRSKSDKRSGGGTGGGSTTSGGEGPGNVSSDGTAGGTSSAATSGAGGSGAVDPDATPGVMNQGGFISRRKKT